MPIMNAFQEEKKREDFERKSDLSFSIDMHIESFGKGSINTGLSNEKVLDTDEKIYGNDKKLRTFFEANKNYSDSQDLRSPSLFESVSIPKLVDNSEKIKFFDYLQPDFQSDHSRRVKLINDPQSFTANDELNRLTNSGSNDQSDLFSSDLYGNALNSASNSKLNSPESLFFSSNNSGLDYLQQDFSSSMTSCTKLSLNSNCSGKFFASQTKSHEKFPNLFSIVNEKENIFESVRSEHIENKEETNNFKFYPELVSNLGSCENKSIEKQIENEIVDTEMKFSSDSVFDYSNKISESNNFLISNKSNEVGFVSSPSHSSECAINLNQKKFILEKLSELLTPAITEKNSELPDLSLFYSNLENHFSIDSDFSDILSTISSIGDFLNDSDEEIIGKNSYKSENKIEIKDPKNLVTKMKRFRTKPLAHWLGDKFVYNSNNDIIGIEKAPRPQKNVKNVKVPERKLIFSDKCSKNGKMQSKIVKKYNEKASTEKRIIEEEGKENVLVENNNNYLLNIVIKPRKSYKNKFSFESTIFLLSKGNNDSLLKYGEIEIPLRPNESLVIERENEFLIENFGKNEINLLIYIQKQ